MIQVRYIGTKEQKGDNVAGTGAVWNGPGDVQSVPDGAWAKLSAHPSVWERVDEPGGAGLASKAPGKKTTKTTDPDAFKLQHADGSTLDLASLDDAALAAFVAEHELTVPPTKKGDALRQAIVDAIKAASKES